VHWLVDRDDATRWTAAHRLRRESCWVRGLLLESEGCHGLRALLLLLLLVLMGLLLPLLVLLRPVAAPHPGLRF
jgi:hypothetical protein